MRKKCDIFKVELCEIRKITSTVEVGIWELVLLVSSRIRMKTTNMEKKKPLKEEQGGGSEQLRKS